MRDRDGDLERQVRDVQAREHVLGGVRMRTGLVEAATGVLEQTGRHRVPPSFGSAHPRRLLNKPST
jgi:hypothetical protein